MSLSRSVFIVPSVVAPLLVAMVGCSAAGDGESTDATSSAFHAEATQTPGPPATPVPVPNCMELVAECTRLANNIAPNCTLDHLGTTCQCDSIGRNTCSDCASACAIPSAPGDESCFAACTANQENCIEGRWNYPRFQAARRAARDAGCNVTACTIIPVYHPPSPCH